MNIFDLDIIEAFLPTLEEAKNITIIGHKHPDPDCIGSGLAILHFFDNKGKNTNYIVPDELPAFMDWLPDKDKITVFEQDPMKAVDIVAHTDIIFFVDWGGYKRIGNLKDVVEVSNALKIMIDHHAEPEPIADFSFVDDKRGSAAELVYEFLAIVDKNSIDKDVAFNIYMGIESDTGGFRYNTVTYKTHQIASELLQYQFDKQLIINGLYNNYSFERLKLTGEVLSKNLYFDKETGIAFMWLSLRDKERFNYKPGDHDNFVNLPLSVKDIVISAIITENQDVVRISLRSKGNYDVSKIAKKFFGGGGHINAAGGNSPYSLEETLAFFKKNLKTLKETATN